MSIEAIASAAAAVTASPYLASLTITAPDRTERRWWRPRRTGAGRIAVTAACAAVLALLAAAAARPSAAMPAFLVLAMLGAVLVVVDAEHHRLPNRITLAAAVLGAAGLTAAAAVDGAWPDLTRAGLAAAAVFALFYVLALISPRGVGLGDVKLAGLLAGFLGWLGWVSVVVGLAVGFLAAGALAIVLLVTRRATHRTHIPLGPFLVVAALVVAAYGVEPNTRAVILPLAVSQARPVAAAAAVLDRPDLLPVLPDRPHPGGYERGCGRGRAACSARRGPTTSMWPAGGTAAGRATTSWRPSSTKCSCGPGRAASWSPGSCATRTPGNPSRLPRPPPATSRSDHVLALALAWDLGAAGWDPDRRREFANDPANLLAVSRAQNQAKGDNGPAEWLPPDPGFRCSYASIYIDVSTRYGLPIAAGDAAAHRTALAGCP